MYCKLIALNARFIHSCPALFYVRSELETHLPGCRPEISQFTINDPYYPTLRRIASGSPEAFFFSTYIWNSLYIERLIRDLVRLKPDKPVILGGPQATALAHSLQQDVLKQCTFIKGEIEGVAESFYTDLQRGELESEYSCTRKRAFKSPYRKEDFSGPLLNRHIYYESSRGCPFGCTYCLSAFERGVRHLNLEQVFAEIKAIMEHSPRVVRFVDRTFNDLEDRALEIWRFLSEQPGDTLFHFEMAPDRFTDDMFQFLEQVGPGKFQFEIGVQSTNLKTLDAIDRKCDLEKLRLNIPKLAALDTIHLHLDLILGLPYEDRESFGRSFADVFALGPHYIQMGLLKVLPDTPISSNVEEYGMIVCESPPYEILANRWIDKNELEDLYWFGECVEAFYNNRYFRSFWHYLRRTGVDIFEFFQDLLELCREKSFFDLAPTQELLSSLIFELTHHRADKELIRELLVFDWLRCGHRYLPEHLELESPSRLKKALWKQLPQNLKGVYDHKTRDGFFKQGVFVEFSGQLLREVGVSNEGREAYLCFQPERENTVFRLNRFVLLG
jgi:radical SAM superfamily enzyme YgiQ (UPF0313 family)